MFKNIDPCVKLWQTLQNIFLKMTGNEIDLRNFYSEFEKTMPTFCCRFFLNAKLFTVTFVLDKIDLGKYNKIKYYQPIT